MERSAGQGESPSRRMANRAPSQSAAPTRAGRSSKQRSFTTERRQGPGENAQRPTLNAQRPIRKALFSAGNLLHERVETRIAAQTIEQRVGLDHKKIVGVTLLIGTLQFLDCALLVAQTCINQR